MNIDDTMISTRSSYIVEKEMKDIVDKCYKEVLFLLESNKEKLEQLKDLLVEQEIVDGEDVYEIVASCHVPPS